MADETEGTGAWSRPDGALEPEDYVQEDGSADEPDDGRPAEDGDPSADPLSPGASVVDDSDGGDADAVEPNEPG